MKLDGPDHEKFNGGIVPVMTESVTLVLHPNIGAGETIPTTGIVVLLITVAMVVVEQPEIGSVTVNV